MVSADVLDKRTLGFAGGALFDLAGVAVVFYSISNDAMRLLPVGIALAVPGSIVFVVVLRATA